MIGHRPIRLTELTAENLRRLVPDMAERDVYLCASTGMSAAVRKALRKARLPDRRLHEVSVTI